MEQEKKCASKNVVSTDESSSFAFAQLMFVRGQVWQRFNNANAARFHKCKAILFVSFVLKINICSTV